MAHHDLALPAERALVLLAGARKAGPLAALPRGAAEEGGNLVDTLVPGPQTPAHNE